MDPTQVDLVTRPFAEITDDVLTAVAGGVTNEPVVFDAGSARYPLTRPAQEVRSVTGRRHQARSTFVRDVDYAFDAGRNEVAWLGGGAAPDDGSTFYVDYFPIGAASPLTDLNVGSVTRTLAEAFAREAAVLHEEVNQAYRAGYVDTATGTALDLVVAVLGVERKTGDFAQGLVTFFRDPDVPGTVAVPAATVLRTTSGAAEFVTTEPRTLQRGQARVDVPVRAGDAFRGPAGQVAAGEIAVLVQALAGIARVTNLDPTALGGADETDADLRVRAKGALRSAGRATLAAIQQALDDARVGLGEVRDPDGAPGRLALVVRADAARLPDALAAVHDTRAAGIVATVQGRYVYVTPRVLGTVDPALTPAGRLRAAADLVQAVQGYLDGLHPGDPLVGSALTTALRTVPDVAGVRVVDLAVAVADLTGTGAATSGPVGGPVDGLVDGLVDRLVAAVTAAGTDPAALRAAITGVVGTGAPAPPAGEVPAPELVVRPDGSRATPADLESGGYRVLATVRGEPWSIALRMTPDDVRLPSTGA